MTELLVIDRVSKSFPGQVALDEVDLVINAGTTHALVGQNGSGKSTLIKILCGYHQPTGPSSATIHGEMVHGGAAELTLGMPRRRRGRYPLRPSGPGPRREPERRREHRDGRGLHDPRGAASTGPPTPAGPAAPRPLGFTDIDVTVPVGTLAPLQKTAVAIARALHGWEHGAHLLVLDEPTASLPGADVERLFAAIRHLKARGVAILYVSHHLDEVFAIADEVTVLRDGRRVATCRSASSTTTGSSS